MIKNKIIFGAHHLHYKILGSGRHAMLAFHGYGQSATFFESLADKLGKEYTIYAFDLFFHGDSYWSDTEIALEKPDLKAMLQEVLTKHSIEQFAVCGYSMGGKFALASLEFFPSQINQCLLIAPDGIKTSFWYSLATYPHWFRNIFKQIIKNPQLFYKITTYAKKIGIVDKSILKFATSQMKTQEQRERVYFTWVIFRHLKFSMREISDIINQQAIPTIMVTGSYDKIITSKNMHQLLQYLANFEEVVLPTGHNQLIAETADYLADKKALLKFRGEK
ncbi:MAG: pimeloyl-ACP methyl ester carboxylesterase [Marivirga sp.]|jgi:pimeloyl-ACP methyl ester carboxylesterase